MRKGPRTTDLVLLIVPALAVWYFIINAAIFRDLWFDEALTFLNFARQPGIERIYRNYVIPNNQILFSILLKYWYVLQPSFLRLDFFMRLLPLIFAGGALWVLFLWRRFFSRRAVYLIMAALAMSLPFEIYSVALRAYMPSLFLLVLAVYIALRFQRKPGIPWGIGYFFVSLAAVAALPTNIIPLGGIALWFMPLNSPRDCRRFRWWFLAAAPLAALALFYLPILNNVQKVLALKEGWDNNFAAAVLFYAAFFLTFLPLAVTACMHRAHWDKWLKVGGGVLLPLFFFLSRSPAPFPRVFFPYWAVLLLVLADGLNSFLAVRRRTAVYPVLAALVCIGAAGMHAGRLELSNFFAGGHNMDDYFYPSYARPEFKPQATVRLLAEMNGRNLPPVYVSFQADFYPMVFYGMVNGIEPGVWRFDNPRTRVGSLPPGALAVLSDTQEDLDDFIKRFGVTPVYLAASGFHRIYRIP